MYNMYPSLSYHTEWFHCSENALCQTFLSLHPPAFTIQNADNHWSFLLPFPECYIVRIIQNVAFLDWHFWLCKMLFRFFNVFMWLCSSFIFLYLLRFIFPCICKHIYKSLNRIRLQTVDVNIVTFGWWFKSEFFSN